MFEPYMYKTEYLDLKLVILPVMLGKAVENVTYNIMEHVLITAE